jgi:ABC-type transport system involved in cytochrome c biogenesis permease subunit
LIMRILGSTWFAITLLVFIFLYSSVGSAVPPVRQGVLADWFGWEALRFEMTEMEWFCSPVFVALVSLFCLSMIVATIRRIPLNPARLGEWIVHLGALVMVVGCFIYFGRKVEGDAVIYKRAALVSAPGVATPVKMIIRPGANVTVGTGNTQYRISVNRIVPRYEVPVGPNRGKQTTAVWFGVQSTGSAQPARFTRVMLAGYPSLTEDIAGTEAGTRPAGRGVFDANLRIDLDYEPQDTFFLEHTAAIYARFDPHANWVEMPVRKLPRYYEHIPDAADISPGADGFVPPTRPIDIAAAPGDPTSPDAKALAGIRFRAIGYLPYAQLESHYVPGGNRLNPVIRFSLVDGQGRQSYELAAFDPTRNRIGSENGRFRIDFRWAASAEEHERLAVKHKPRLEFRVAGKPAPIELPLSSLLDKGPQSVPGTDYKVTIGSSDIMLNFPLMSEALRGQSDDVVIVSVERGDKKFRRLVFAEHADQSRDLSEMHTPLPEFADRDLQIRFVDPAPSGATLIGGPTDKDCEIVVNALDGEQTRRPLPVGEATTLAQNTAPLTIDALIPQAVQDTRPSLVPRNQRQPLQSVGAAMSLLDVEVDDGTREQRVWLPFNRYAFPDETYAYPERFQYGSYMPRTVVLADGRTLELLYSRERRYLPASIALEQFVLETLPGGQRERDFISEIRFYEKDHWSPVREVRSNQPGQYGGLWFFQSEWDPKNEAMTVLGVGNREGIGIMLGGVLLSILGMIYSFYIKPIVLRRRMARDAAALASETMGAPGAAAQADASSASQKKKRLPTPTASRVGLIAAMATLVAAGATARADESSFARDVDLSQIRLIAAQHDGRLKPFDTLARETIQQITGERFFDGQDPVFTYLDLMFDPAAYANRNLIFVKKARVRESLIKAAGSELGEAEASYIRQTKRIPPRFLSLPGVQQELEALESDTMNTGRDADMIRTAQAYADPRNLRGFLLVAPPPGGTSHSPWLSVDDITGGSSALAGVDPDVRNGLASNWKQLETAWRGKDAAGASRAMNALAAELPKVEPRLYPERSRLAMERWYFKYKALTGVWFIYFAAVVCLLPAFLLRSGAARRLGMLAFFVAFVLQTVSIGVRWYLARRIPTANMFEAVTAAAWSGAAIALILEVWLRRRPMRNLLALGASFCAALALMCGYYMPNLLSANISNPMPILNTVWLKIHVSLILISYILIGVSFVTATLYLVLRAAARLSSSERLRELWAGPAGAGPGRGPRAPLPDGETATGLPFGFAMSEPPALGGSAAVCRPTRSPRTITGAILSLAGIFVLALLLRPEFGRTVAGVATAASAGAAIGRGLYALLLVATVVIGPAFTIWLLTGTARIIFGRDDATQQGLRAPLAAVLDGSTMLLIEGAFVTLWVGIILGAAWADVSWGRPWGWDPKEVFALNTWLIFVGLIHIRLNVRDKGLWTAILAVAGFAVMMFNWVGVNYFIVGLHSYA